MLSLTWRGALAWRMRQHLLEPVGSTSAAGVVRALVAVAAQLEPAAAELGVRIRRRSSRAGDLQQAWEEGRIVKTFAFRGATHFMTPDIAGTHLALRAASRMWERSSWQSHYGLTPADWPALREAVREALVAGPLTRAELGAAVAAHARFRHLTPAFTDPSATFLKPLAWQGDLSLAPSRDGQMTLQRLDGRPGWSGLPELDEAGPAAVEAYLRAYGPASVDNVRYWLGQGLGVRRALIRQWLAGLEGRLSTVEVEAEPRLVLRDDLDALAATGPTSAVRLLPRYDQWLLGPGTADAHVVPAAIRSEVSRGGNAVIVGGVVAGTWSLTDDAVSLSWATDTELPADDLLDTEVTRLAGILGRPLRLAASGSPP